MMRLELSICAVLDLTREMGGKRKSPRTWGVGSEGVQSHTPAPFVLAAYQHVNDHDTYGCASSP